MPTDFELLLRFLILQQRHGPQLLAPNCMSRQLSKLMQASSDAAPLLPLTGCYPVQVGKAMFSMSWHVDEYDAAGPGCMRP